MALNDPGAPQSASRKPRIRALLNGSSDPSGGASFSGGTAPDGLIDVDLTSNNWYSCDRVNLTFALVPGSTFDAAWWAAQTDIAVTVQMGFLPDGQLEGAANIAWTTVILAGVDQVTIDPVMGTVQIEGRDLSYLLIESRTQEEFNNRTSSQVVTELAGRHNLTPVVTATSIPVDRYYASDHTKTTHGTFHRQTTEWDLCVFLAQRENFDLFVTGRELHFQPRALPNADPWVVRFSDGSVDGTIRLNTSTLRLQRALLIAKDISVEVRSWSSKSNQAVVATAHKTGFGRVSAGGTSRAKGGASTAQQFVYVFPNLTKDQCQQKAEQLLRELSQHERVIEYDQPGILTITPRNKIRVTGTNTSFDQDYFIDHIRRRISYASGFVMSVRAKSMDTASQITVE